MNTLQKIHTEAEKAITSSSSKDELESVRLTYLGKKGIISGKMRTLGSLSPDERKTFGAELNRLKDDVANLIDNTKAKLEEEELSARLAEERVDVTLPIRPEQKGKIHPITKVTEEIIEIFGSMGFVLTEGSEIEDDFHNFTALNIPKNHPARQMHDTFYFPEDENGEQKVLRTHTSPVQIRYMENNKPPYHIIAPGRTYRCDSDITHSPMFHQVEGLYIDKDISMGHLKGCLIEFVETFFGVSDVPVRFRPSFFPFTEPSAEMDIGCERKNGEFKIGAFNSPTTSGGGKGGGWLEVLGCGMVHPNVLRNVNVDPEEYQGFAFGLGIERLAMLKYGIPDLRTFFDSDIRWLEHFGFEK